MRLLLVDDERAILGPMSRFMRGRGIDLDTAEDFASARALLERGRYDVVVADLRLSPFEPAEGLELLDLAGRRDPSVRRVLLTAYGSAEVEARARALGVDRVLNKPLPLAGLLALIRELGGEEAE